MNHDSSFICPPVTLLGVGGLGTALLPALYRLAPERLTLWDDDTVSPENLVNQFFWQLEDVGLNKAHVAASMYQKTDRIGLGIAKRYRSENLFDSIVISAVDSLDSRRAIWSGVKRSQLGNAPVPLFVDGRLSREKPFFAQLFVIPLDNPEACEWYEDWLIGEDTPDSGRRSPDMAAAPLVLAGLIVLSIVQWCRRDRVPWQTVWSGMSMSLTSFYSI